MMAVIGDDGKQFVKSVRVAVASAQYIDTWGSC
jgi:hypothetical protein